MKIRALRWRRWTVSGLAIAALQLILGCYTTPTDTSEYTRGPAPLRMPAPEKSADGCCYEDTLTGGQVFSMYCAACHNARTLAERPFANYQNAAVHMRVRANLTGKEYAELMVFLRRWHDVPEAGQREASSPKRFIFSQPIQELRQQQSTPDLPAGPRPGFSDDITPGQPSPGSSPREAR